MCLQIILNALLSDVSKVSQTDSKSKAKNEINKVIKAWSSAGSQGPKEKKPTFT